MLLWELFGVKFWPLFGVILIRDESGCQCERIGYAVLDGVWSCHDFLAHPTPVTKFRSLTYLATPHERHDPSAATIEIPASAPRKYFELTFGLLRLCNDQIEECSLFLGQLPPELRERFAG
jgi:hypothetical protein